VLLVKAVSVTIVFDSKRHQCEGQCGLNWSSSEITGTVRQRIKERFGEAVTLEVVDLSIVSKRSDTLQKRLANENLYLPVLLVNDEMRIPGEFDVRQLMDAIEVEQEIDGKSI